MHQQVWNQVVNAHRLHWIMQRQDSVHERFLDVQFHEEVTERREKGEDRQMVLFNIKNQPYNSVLAIIKHLHVWECHLRMGDIYLSLLELYGKTEEFEIKQDGGFSSTVLEEYRPFLEDILQTFKKAYPL